MTGERHFVTSIGTGRYEETEYALRNRTWRTSFAPVATARLIDLQAARGLVLVTNEARQKHYDALAHELRGAGVLPEPICIPEGRTEEEVLSIFTTLQAEIPEHSRVVLDVTFALRHLPFVYLATLVYLSGLRAVQIEGIYYGAYQLKTPVGLAPIIEITGLFDLLRWYHALAGSRDSGEWLEIARALRSDVARLFRRGVGDRELSRLQTPTEQLAHALAMGLPIEAGLRAADLREALTGLTHSGGGAVAARLALATLREQLPSWAVEPKPPQKSSLPLTLDELWRQLRVAEWYLRLHEYDKSLLVMRECLVSALLCTSGETRRWLDYGHRKPVEEMLNAVSERAKAGVATDREKTLASLWDAIAKKRNRFAHAGMTEEVVSASDQEIAALLERCRALLGGDALTELPRSSGARLLITPVGLSPGVLYSGALHVKPDRLLIVTSQQAATRISEALEHARSLQTPQQTLVLEDAFLGYREVDRHLGSEMDRAFVAADQLIVNVTGGTTVMQYAVERLASRARDLGVPVRRVALIDRRSPEEQRANPYVLGEIVWLDDDEKGPSPSSSPAGDAGEEN
jgi:hypothetical protein